MNTTNGLFLMFALCFCTMSLSAEKLQHATLKPQVIEGWTVRVDEKLLSEDQEKTARILRNLRERLANIKIIIPQPHLEELQKVALVLEKGHAELKAMQYHPGVEWLKNKGYDETLVHCVHLPVAGRLVAKRQITTQPWVILHELAHAYHHQVLGFDNKEIIEAYEKFKASGHGEDCLHYSGKRVEHYGLTNHKEFFAEMTEAYFGTNDFYPFNHGELKEAEPEIYELIEKIWKPTK